MRSEPFRMQGKDFLAVMAALYGLPWILLFSLLLIGAVVAGVTVDMRWLIVALMILCLIVPMAVALLYFNHGLKEVTVLNTIPHRLEADDSSLTFILLKDDEERRGKEIPFCDLDRFFTGSDYVVFPLRERKRGVVWIPVSAFEGFSEFRRMVERISVKNEDNCNENIKGEK